MLETPSPLFGFAPRSLFPSLCFLLPPSSHRFRIVRMSTSEVVPPLAPEEKSAPRLHEDGVEGIAGFPPSPLPARDMADDAAAAFAAFAAAVPAVSVAVTVPGCRGAPRGMKIGAGRRQVSLPSLSSPVFEVKKVREKKRDGRLKVLVVGKGARRRLLHFSSIGNLLCRSVRGLRSPSIRSPFAFFFLIRTDRDRQESLR